MPVLFPEPHRPAVPVPVAEGLESRPRQRAMDQRGGPEGDAWACHAVAFTQPGEGGQGTEDDIPVVGAGGGGSRWPHSDFPPRSSSWSRSTARSSGR